MMTIIVFNAFLSHQISTLEKTNVQSVKIEKNWSHIRQI